MRHIRKVGTRHRNFVHLGWAHSCADRVHSRGCSLWQAAYPLAQPGRAVGGRALEHSRAPAFPARRLAWSVRRQQMNDGSHSLLRTWLFGPGADRAVHEAMSTSRADVLIQDLEDFTPPQRRDEARALAAGLFARWRAVGARVCVRINSLHEDGPLDLSCVVPAKPDFVAYPKAATARDVRDLDRAITSAEEQAGLPPGSIGILPVCETALGVVNVREIAEASSRIRY